MPEQTRLLDDERALIRELVADQAEQWDLSGELPIELLRKLGARGLLCAEVPTSFGGLGLDSRQSGELTAYVGSLCSSTRSIMTSHGMAAWMVSRFGDRTQRRAYLAELTSGQLAAVGFSEPGAGSDLAAMRTRIRRDGDGVVVTGEKKWVTGARYADYLMILGRQGDEAGVVVVPTSAPGVELVPIATPVLGCRAAGHWHVRLNDVRLPAGHLLGGGGQDLSMLFTTALSYGRISVAWGCTGIVRACLKAATEHARRREQFGKPIGEHQLVARHLAELLVAEQVATRACEHASAAWQSFSPDMVIATVLAKHVSAGQAASSAATAVQVLGSAGATDGHVVARAYRDAKLMELIEGSNEICQLILADHALSTSF
ncbi:alkylation response protein AidB-like acyl-CoA dehydrogenase [Thermocatellispora tengchongensis]|uniref:Alkylation response protein AidB-like acyl-CoA dehydrogenase n=1 Tax=Thermocatellispora tengchongensis TaxID=1073253 RepID=A0A840PN69_9ACTN|nr:acyl-CoA dehydrogenase family protein [Thermocatellispora tengchongensis]MBB5137475.1 alkylation response protein AidB-like acyl-CoA dehydrogenase [Thermocatellispora tengchongensis]